MKHLLLLFPLISLTLLTADTGDYLDNHSCKECHEAIYEEYQESAHARSYFSDELHRKIAQKADPDRYECAPCHMPAVKNLDSLVTGQARPDPRDKRAKDGVSCYFCHTIAYVKKAHRFNINTQARQAKGYKPSFFGSLFNPDESDKHSSLKSPIYQDNVCMGCHSHKVNENNVTVFRVMGPTDTSRGCVRCHMPKIPGGVEKMNKKDRSEHYSHNFPGIRDLKFAEKGYEIRVEKESGGIAVTLVNKMPHPMIIQPARAKYMVIEVKRDGKRVWRNYKTNPEEDSKAYFVMHFFKEGKAVAFPSHATSVKANNLQGKEERTLHYEIPELKKGDEVSISLYVLPAKGECRRAISLEDRSYLEPHLLKKVSWKVP